MYSLYELLILLDLPPLAGDNLLQLDGILNGGLHGRVGFYRAVLQRYYPNHLEIESKYW